ncbi:HNH endonuclease signature motif containing protein [Enterococcus rivorum]|uniref:HNH endonuclease signature motif containing protein n=1 Tax=Enterococcus rivorum TaxID=762845 RepID=UPI001FE0831E|nr:HNH endonuclease signature motif containing protein [Enterococcus rivorum]
MPINKGTKGMYNVGGNSTSFKKGEKPVTYKPVGSEMIDKDGYTLIKVKDDGPYQERWVNKQRVIWEKENGPIPKGHVILFADGNKGNLDIENLILISQSQLVRLNKNGWIGKSKEVTEVGIKLADITSIIAAKKKSFSE